jgi:hypothetical protein
VKATFEQLDKRVQRSADDLDLHDDINMALVSTTSPCKTLLNRLQANITA